MNDASTTVASSPSPTKPAGADRKQFAALVILCLVIGWLTWAIYVLASYGPVVEWTRESLDWPLRLCVSLRPQPPSVYGTFGPLENAYAWGPGAIWGVWYFGDWWISPIPIGPREWTFFPAWILPGLWTLFALLMVRSLWDRRGPFRRRAARIGHLFYAGRIELSAVAIAGAFALPLLALWRLERAAWEGAFLNGPPWMIQAFDESYHTLEGVMLLQVALIHWLILWQVYKRLLLREARRGTAAPVEHHARAPDRHCPWCGYEHTADRCPECGHTPSIPPSASHLRISLGPLTRSPWLRWILRTPTAIALAGVLFMSPVWLPYFARTLGAILP